jgi:signal transduction histidine kinase
MDQNNHATGVVLAVDDTPGNLRVLVDSLGGAGHEVLVATDGTSAIETALYAKPDLILLDVMMPDIDGYETCQRLKSDEATAKIPIIFMTALSETAEKVKAFELGAVDYITKPFEHAELLARVSTHLTINRLRTDLENRNVELEELNKLKNEFMGMAAHDVRNPLASVVACADLVDAMIDTASTEKIRSFVHQISEAAKRINAIITNLLDVNTIDSGERKLNISPRELNGIVERVVLQNSHKAREKNIELMSIMANERLLASVDEDATEQVLDNIISNAVKYSPPGNKVYIRLDSDKLHVRVEVKDEGPGIPLEDQAQMYGKFCRLTPKPTAGEPSTGLGLWIVKELTEAMSGTINCESEVGEGTVFVVAWPRAGTSNAAAA